MDRMRHTYVRQDSKSSSTGTPSESTSPLVHRHSRSGGAAHVGLGNVRRTQQTKAAAARLAQVMAHEQPGDSDDDEDDLDLYDYNPGSASSGLGLVGSRPAARSRSPLMSARTSKDGAGAGRFGTGLRSSHSAGSVEQEQSSSRYSLSGRSSQSSSVGVSPARSVPVIRPSQSTTTAEPAVSPYARPTPSPAVGKISSAYSALGNRSSQSTNSAEPVVSPYARSSAALAIGKISSTYSVPGNRSSQPTNSTEPVVSPYARSPVAPAIGKISSTNSVPGNRSSQSTDTAEPVVSPYARSPAAPAIGKISSTFSVPGNRSFRSTNTAEPIMSPIASSNASVEQAQPPSARSSSPGPIERVQISSPLPSLRSFRSNSMEQSPSARANAVGRPSVGLKPVTMVPSAAPVTLKAATSETQLDIRKEKKLVDFGTFKCKDAGIEATASSALQDELDMLQEENESLIEKLRLAEARCEEAEARARQLEQQITNLGDGVSLEARLLSRKEAALQQREEALKEAALNSGGSSVEVVALRMEAETARDAAATASEKLHGVVAEFKSLRSMTQRMILTQEEMEEVVLKRCWLSRYWCLCVRHGIHAEVAEARHEYWSTLAPLPVEVVLAAAERGKEEGGGVINDAEERERKVQQSDELSGEGNVENMLLVDKGLKELTCLKVEEALVIAMAQKRRAATATSNVTDELKLPIEGMNYSEAFELTEEEQEDVTFKQAWLAYFWRRVKNHGLEPDISDERVQYWIERLSRLPVSNDAVDVERGLMELKKLAIEIKLWELSRLSVDPDSAQKTLLDFES